MLYKRTLLKKINLTFIFFVFFFGLQISGGAQFVDDFEDGTILLNPVWSGNTDHFLVNTEKQLQLNAAAAGESFIYAEYSRPKDSIEMDIYFKMTFDPSDNNSSIIYLAIDNADIQSAHGYYLKLGENGSNDNIKFYRTDVGVSTLLASCTLAAISKDPAQARVKVRINKDGLWSVETNYQGGSLLIPDVEFMDAGIYNLPEKVIFGIYCKYTSTRLKNFFYDDLSIRTWVPDTIPPQLALLTVKDVNTLELVFTERLDPASTLEATKYQISPALGAPAMVEFGNDENIVVLTFDDDIQSGVEYTLNMSGLEDQSGNIYTGSKLFLRAVTPGPSELVLNEVLTDPISGGEDFIELYNISDKFLELQGVIIRNVSKNEEKAIVASKILKPGEYIAISKDTSFLKAQYYPAASATFLQNDLPSLNISDANIQIMANGTSGKVIIDSFAYEESYHYALLNDTKGVSLERIIPNGPSNDPQNWHSAASSTNYATPGYKNSNFRTISNASTEVISIPEKVFSPNGGSGNPYLLIQYDVEKSGYLLSIQIFDTEGFSVRTLLNNELIGTRGVIQWDGLDHEGQPVRVGWYVIASQVFHPDGDVKHYKHTVVAGE